MTQEEKARAYDEALERAKELLNSPRTCFDINQIEDIFPQLAESEDERIRKWLYDYISNCPNDNFAFYGGVGKDAVLNYLEKQKPTPDWMPRFLDELRSQKHYFDWDEHRDIEGHILAIINWIAPNYFNKKEKEQLDTYEPIGTCDKWTEQDMKVNEIKVCRDCWHNYHCPMPQEGYEFNPDTCKYNPDNKSKKQ